MFKVIEEREVLGKEFRIYGTIEEPLFLAKDVASRIDHKNILKTIKKTGSKSENKKSTRFVSTLLVFFILLVYHRKYHLFFELLFHQLHVKHEHIY